jgi:hypothetical protein
VTRGLARIGLVVLTIAASSAAATDAAAFEQVQRVNALTLAFGTDSFATANAFGGAMVGATTQSQLQTSIDSSVADGSTTWLLDMRGLTDLSGTSSPGFSLGIIQGTPLNPPGNPTSYDGSSDLDWWYAASAIDLDADGSPIQQLPASIAAGVFDAGPGSIALNTSLLGSPMTLSISNARLRAMSGAASTPLESTNGFPPGHLPDENLPDSLTSFGSMSTGQLAGNISARSLANTQIPSALAGSGLLNCTKAYTLTNTLLDLLVGGCSIIIGQQIKPTQPDRAAVGGDTYTFTTTTNQVTGCTRNGAAASLSDCLDGAAYSAYFRFTADRVIVPAFIRPVEPGPDPDPDPGPAPNPNDSTSPPSNSPPDGSAPESQSPPAEFARTLRLAYSRKRRTFTGKLASDARPCIARQKILIYGDRKKGRDPKVGTATTSNSGKYSLKKNNAKGKFYASVKRTSTQPGMCLAARSKAVNVH